VRRGKLIAGLATAGIVLVGAAGIAAGHGRGVRTEAAIRPYDVAHAGVIVGAKARGEARTRTRDGRTEVRVRARGLPHGAALEARLHDGRCADFGDTFTYAGSGEHVVVVLRSGRSGQARERVKVAPIPDGRQFSIVIHGESGARIACGDLLPD
jgi:hypothetical protein